MAVDGRAGVASVTAIAVTILTKGSPPPPTTTITNNTFIQLDCSDNGSVSLLPLIPSLPELFFCLQVSRRFVDIAIIYMANIEPFAFTSFSATFRMSHGANDGTQD